MTVTVATARGTIYDRNMQPLVNTGTQNRVSVAPYPVAVAALSEALAAEEFEALAARLQSGPTGYADAGPAACADRRHQSVQRSGAVR